jgi:hypothetical protein
MSSSLCSEPYLDLALAVGPLTLTLLLTDDGHVEFLEPPAGREKCHSCGGSTGLIPTCFICAAETLRTRISHRRAVIVFCTFFTAVVSRTYVLQKTAWPCTGCFHDLCEYISFVNILLYICCDHVVRYKNCNILWYCERFVTTVTTCSNFISIYLVTWVKSLFYPQCGPSRPQWPSGRHMWPSGQWAGRPATAHLPHMFIGALTKKDSETP